MKSIILAALIEIVQLVKAFAILWLLGPGQAISSHFVVTTKTYQHRSVWPKETSELCKKNLKKIDKWWPSSNSSNYSPSMSHLEVQAARTQCSAHFLVGQRLCQVMSWLGWRSQLQDIRPISDVRDQLWSGRMKPQGSLKSASLKTWTVKDRVRPRVRSSTSVGHKKGGLETYLGHLGIIFLGWKQIGAK